MGAYATAHSVYTTGCSERGLDYPEYLLDAWVAFELECGTLADVEFALAKSKRQRKGLERRRARVRPASPLLLRCAPVKLTRCMCIVGPAQEAAEAAAKAAASAPADADSFIASAVQGSGAATSAGEGSKKRERSPGAAAGGAAATGGEQGNKKARVHEPEEQKRCVALPLLSYPPHVRRTDAEGETSLTLAATASTRPCLRSARAR